MPDTALNTDTDIDWVARAKEVAPIIEAAATQTEADRKVTPEAMKAMHEAGLFRLSVPKAAGGFEAPVEQIIQAVEIVAGADASAGWCMGQGLGCARSSAFLDPEIAREIWDTPDGVLAWGPPAGPMRAVAVEGGYRVTGKWQFASGIMNATWVGPNLPVFDEDGERRLDEDGKPESRNMLIRKKDVQINDVWQVIGLRGTGSNGFEVEDFFVPEEFTFIRDSRHYRRCDAPLYRIPLTTYYGMAFGSVALGVARPVLDSFIDMAETKKASHTAMVLRENPAVQREFATAEAGWGSARAYLHERVNALFGRGIPFEEWSLSDRARLRIASTNAMHQSRNAVNWAYQAAGSGAIFQNNPFEKRLRDINAVCQQAQAQPVNYEHAGGALMGVETSGGRV